MSNFEFLAINAKGKDVAGAVEADNQRQAIVEIKAKGLFPTMVRQVSVKADSPRPIDKAPVRKPDITFLDRLLAGKGKVDQAPVRKPDATESVVPLGKCKDCGHSVSQSAANCPNCGAKMVYQMSGGDMAAGCLVFVGLMVVLAIGFFLLSNSDNGASKMNAFLISQTFVKKQSQQSGSMRFPPCSDSDSFVTDLGGGRFEVSAYVDEGDGRMHYDCIVRHKGGDDWHCEKLVVEGVALIE